MVDVIFIGGGLNYAGAVVAAKRGLKTVLIEKSLDHLGGTCLHEGCIPSKHFLHLSETLVKLKNPAFKIRKDHLKLDVAVKEKDELVQKAAKSVRMQCEAAGVELVEGEGFVIEPHKVKVADQIYEGKNIIIGTGSHPFIPDGIEYDGQCVITSNEVLRLKAFPQSIAVYGSGAIGLEMAGFFAANGVETHLFYRHDHISSKIHPELLKRLEAQLRNLGIVLHPNTTILEAKEHERRAKLTTDKGVMEFEKLLVATGRRPNVEVVQTKAIEIEKGILTDDFFQTTLPNHYAVGDCNAKLMLAHAARAQVLNVIEQILGNKERLKLENIPKFIYTLPLQYAVVGTKGAKEAFFPLSAMALTHLVGASEGGVVLYADEEGFLTGAEILAPYAEEIISVVAAALTCESDVKTLLHAVFPHPTIGEAIDRAARKLARG
jgi:dihydrolipoamide dehydrogenase